jgi:HAD superfamily hydrolase (TIGR01509 family)
VGTLSRHTVPVPRPVVFDMDGVLVDSEPLYEAAFRGYMASVGRPELGDLFSITLGRRPAEFVPDLAGPLGREPGEIGAGLDAAAAAAMVDAELVAMPHARAAVERVAAGDRLVGLASSSPRAFIERVLRTLGIAERFTAIVSGDEVTRGKPDPEIYRLAAARLGAAPEQCVAIEDTEAGVSAAAAAGMTTIAVPNRYTGADRLAHADAIVPDLDEAAALILRLDGAVSRPGSPCSG